MVNFRINRGIYQVATPDEIQALAKKHGLDCSHDCSLHGITITVAWTPPIPPEDKDKIGKHDHFILEFFPTSQYRGTAPGWAAEYVVDLAVRHEAHPEFSGEPRPSKTNYPTLPELKAMPMAERIVGFVEDAMIGNFPALSHICLGLGPARQLHTVYDVPATTDSVELAARANLTYRGPGMVIVVAGNNTSSEAIWHPSAQEDEIQTLVHNFNASAMMMGLPNAMTSYEFQKTCPTCADQLEPTLSVPA